MSARRTWAIFAKDLLDALRNARVLVSLATPLALGLLYNAVFPEERLVSVNAAYVARSDSALLQVVRDRAGQTIELKLRAAESEDDARRLVGARTVDVAFVIPADAEAAIRVGSVPTILVIGPEAGGTGTSFVQSALEAGTRQVAGQRVPAVVRVDRISAGSSDAAVVTQLGTRRYFVLATVVMIVGMIAMLAVPIILSEETEKRTLDALLMVASYGEVVVAKAFVGATYVAVAIGVLFALTRLRPESIASFAVATVLLTLSLTALGLLIGGLFRSATQVYTWSTFFLLPVIVPAFTAGLPVPSALDLMLKTLPTTQAMRLMSNGFAGRAIFGDEALGYLVLVAWTVGAYSLLVWRLSRQEH